MKQYEVTFIIDPVLSELEIKQTADNYIDLLKTEGAEIVHVDQMGLRQLAYPLNKRNSGFYFCLEFKSTASNIIERLELALRRDERIMRFLTVRLDKYGIKYNDDKRNGRIGKKEKKETERVREEEIITPVKAVVMPPPVTTPVMPDVEEVPVTEEE